jgi:MFS family permease
MGSFLVVWSGQFVSTVGTLMTSLALAFWAFDATGRATELGLMVFFTFGPRIVLGPLAGALVDRWKRRTVLIACDLIAGAASVAVLILLVTGNLRVAHLYVLTFVMSAFGAFQGPAFIASATMMVPKAQHARMNGLMALIANASAIVAPALAGLLLPVIDLEGILLIDVATFLFATGTLLFVAIPEPVHEPLRHEAGPVRRIVSDIAEGFRYLWTVRSLLALQLVFSSANLFGTFFGVLLRPMILLRTGDSEIALASVQSMIGIGGAIGAAAIAVWGGPKRGRILFAISAFSAAFLLRGLAGLDVSIPWIAAFALAQSALLAVAGSSVRAVWQAKIPPELLGRVFSTLATIAGLLMMITMLSGGPLADRVFEPAMQSGGWLRAAAGRLVGTGPGSGIGLMVLCGGWIAAAICAGGLLFRSLRRIETTIPDYDARTEVVA